MGAWRIRRFDPRGDFGADGSWSGMRFLLLDGMKISVGMELLRRERCSGEQLGRFHTGVSDSGSLAQRNKW